jgi:hypothetical protein
MLGRHVHADRSPIQFCYNRCHRLVTLHLS